MNDSPDGVASRSIRALLTAPNLRLQFDSLDQLRLNLPESTGTHDDTTLQEPPSTELSYVSVTKRLQRLAILKRSVMILTYSSFGPLRAQAVYPPHPRLQPQRWCPTT